MKEGRKEGKKEGRKEGMDGWMDESINDPCKPIGLCIQYPANSQCCSDIAITFGLGH